MKRKALNSYISDSESEYSLSKGEIDDDDEEITSGSELDQETDEENDDNNDEDDNESDNHRSIKWKRAD